MEIRPAILDDTSAIHAMVNHMYEELNYGVQFDESWVAARLKSKFFITLLCTDNNAAVGFCTIKITKDEYGASGTMAFLYELYMQPAYRAKGHAYKLLNQMEKQLKELEISYIELYVHVDNTNGYDFWKKSGFFDKYKVLGKHI